MRKIALLAVFLAVSPSVAFAQLVAPIETAAKQAYLIDTNTGTVLYAKDAEAQMPTSSMSKMMTVYLVFEAIRNGKFTLNDTLPVSKHAYEQGQGGSSMFLKIGQTVRVEDLIRGTVIQSGNDAAAALAEGLGGGSESVFAEMMNAKATALGMTNSHFMNATGLPDPQHYASAHDLAILALALMHDFPEHYHYFSETDFTYNGIKQGNRNPLLYHNMNVDGLKTGHTDAGGFGLTASALRDGRRLTLVLNGLPSMQARADESVNLLDWGYREFGLYPVTKSGEKFAEARVWLGQSRAVPLVVQQDLALTLPRNARSGLKVFVIYNQPVQAPVMKGQPIGKLRMTAPEMEPKEIPLVAANDVPQVGFLTRAWREVKLVLHGGVD